MDNTKTFKFISDSGHGWLVVPLKLINGLGIADKITGCSYISKAGTTVYLEEDLDAGTFLNAIKAQGVDVKFNEKYIDGRCYVRSLRSYPAKRNDEQRAILKSLEKQENGDVAE